MDPLVTDTIMAAEENLRLAMLSSDIDEFERILDDDLLFINHLGNLISKRDDIDLHASGDLEIRDIRLSDQNILMASLPGFTIPKVT